MKIALQASAVVTPIGTSVDAVYNQKGRLAALKGRYVLRLLLFLAHR